VHVPLNLEVDRRLVLAASGNGILLPLNRHTARAAMRHFRLQVAGHAVDPVAGAAADRRLKEFFFDSDPSSGRPEPDICPSADALAGRRCRACALRLGHGVLAVSTGRTSLMFKINRLAAPFAVAGIAALCGLALAAPAGASAAPTSYQANLAPVPLNTPAGAASGQVMLTLDGNQATVTETVTGLGDKLPTDTATLAALGIPAAFAGAPFPHVQHIHIDGQGQCPTASADANGDGVISTVEGHEAYGMIGTTFSTKGATDASTGTDVTVAPGGGSFTYKRTFTMNADTSASVRSGKGVVVVHGLNPATAPKASLSTPNSLDVTLPGQSKKLALIGTAPALCGALQASQMGAMPAGGANTGGGSMAASDGNGAEYAAGGLALVAAAGAGVIALRRRRTSEN
jgi:hypothetical protein